MTVLSITGEEVSDGPLHEGIIKLGNNLVEIAKAGIDDIDAMLTQGWVDLDMLRTHLVNMHDISVFVKAAGISINQGLR